MKGLIAGIKRMEIHDGDGLRTTVFFKGCPLKCIWCHNPESISFKKQFAFFGEKCINCGLCGNERNENTAMICPTEAIKCFGTEYSVEELAEEILKDELFFKNSDGGVTLSGGECLSQPDFAVELSKTLSEKGISVYIDTCGYVEQNIFERIIPYADKFLYDIKAIDSETHKKCTGRDNALILKNLEYLSKNNCNIEIRYPLVKGFNDNQAHEIGRFLKNLSGISKVKVLQYHSFARSRYDALSMKNTLPCTETTYQDIENVVEVLKSYGLNAENGVNN